MVTHVLAEPRKNFYILTWVVTFLLVLGFATVINYLTSFSPVSIADFVARQGNGIGDYPGQLGAFWVLFLLPFFILLFVLHRTLSRNERVRIWTLFLPPAILILVFYLLAGVLIVTTCAGEECMGIIFVPPFGVATLLIFLVLAFALRFASGRTRGQHMLHSWFLHGARRLVIVGVVFTVMAIVFISLLLIDHPTCGRSIGIVGLDVQVKCLIAEAIATGNPDVCEAGYRQASSYCYERLSRHFNDSTLCYKVKEQSTRDACFAFLPVHLRDPSFCNEISAAMLKDDCYKESAIRTNDPALCSKMSSSSQEANCRQQVVDYQATRSAEANALSNP